MSAAPFVHLHTHTYYSLLDGANPIDRLARKAKACGMPAVAMTDHGNLFGAIEFYQTMTDAGLKPIIGCEVYLLTDGLHTDRTIRPGESGFLSHLTLLAANQTGYQNLCRLISIAHLHGFYYKPRIDKPLLAEYGEGLLCLTGCLTGEIARRLEQGDAPRAALAMEWLLQTFGEEQVYVEIMRHGLAAQEKVNPELMALAARYSRPLVATNDCHYCEAHEAGAHDALLCIQTGKALDDEKRLRMSSDQFFFRSPDEMATLFADLPEALASTMTIADRCHVEFDFKTYHFPRFDAPAGKTLDEKLREEALAGLDTRWPLIARWTTTDPAALRAQYDTRLREELECITTMGFSGYFLIVADFILYAKTHDIPVGPGRGSAAGSLVAYCLQITDIDPIRFGLFFERFLNPERISMPDMDIDFCMRKRDAVIRYVQEKYGNVGQIITFGKMKAKAVVRDVARVMGFSYGDADRIAKLIPNTLGITLADALEQEPQLPALAKKEERVARLLTIAQALEGYPRHASTHAAGVVISDRPLTDFLPLYRGSNDEIVTQFDMKGVEKIGLIKFDFLGLKTLTILHDTIALIAAGGAPTLRLEEIPLDDTEVFALLGRGDTAGVFQLESNGMTDLVGRLRPSVFEDIVALVALFRPGPLGSGMVDDFINRKHGRTPISYLLPPLEPILRDSYGVILYQEQVMQIASLLANYSLGEADLLRRAMGKKKPEEMARQKARFLSGAAANRLAPQKAEQIFDLMEKFAGYGFNKAHSVAYALVSYHTAYFKTHYPTEFFAAILSNEMGSTDKVLRYMNDAKAHGIEMLPPDINACDRTFTVVEPHKIRFGLAAVKHVGESAIESIVTARATDGPFTDLFQCCERIDTRRVNRRVIESLIKCGAFDSLKTAREILWVSIDRALDYGNARQRERESGQENLFHVLADPSGEQPTYQTATPWSETERLAGEKEALGFYITGHPLAQYATILQQCASHRTDTAIQAGDRQRVRIGGVPAGVREITTKRGDRMAFVTLEDLHGVIDVVVFAEAYSAAKPLIESETPLFVLGTTDVNEETVKIICEEMIPLQEAPQKMTQSVHVTLSADRAARGELEGLKSLLQQYRGSCPMFLHLIIPNSSETVLRLPADYRVIPSPDLVAAVDTLFGPGSTRFAVA
ncbi:MAG: DNA polymerase III subunit alpha [Deltaproteobacteria bacterium]|nr:DNA polymerase III subunit alpha [Deltaproteobacteria bacterium]